MPEWGLSRLRPIAGFYFSTFKGEALEVAAELNFTYVLIEVQSFDPIVVAVLLQLQGLDGKAEDCLPSMFSTISKSKLPKTSALLFLLISS